MPTGAALWKRVQETFDIVLDCKGGLTYLRYKELGNSADSILKRDYLSVRERPSKTRLSIPK